MRLYSDIHIPMRLSGFVVGVPSANGQCVALCASVFAPYFGHDLTNDGNGGNDNGDSMVCAHREPAAIVLFPAHCAAVAD